NGGIALVELERHPAGDKFLALVDRRLQHFPLGRKPEAVINKFRIFRHQFVFEMCGAAIERDRFDPPVGGEQYRAAWSLVHAAWLHADEAIFDKIEPPDAVGTAELIELPEQRSR